MDRMQAAALGRAGSTDILDHGHLHGDTIALEYRRRLGFGAWSAGNVNRSIIPVILSGGAGSRLWPLSREHHPKQLIALLDDLTLLQATARRLAVLDRAQDPIVVCNDEHRFMVAEQLRAIGTTPSAVLLEPVPRSTAAAVAAAAFEVLARCNDGEDPVLLVLPADHVVGDHTRFAEAVRTGFHEASAGNLVTFGIVPAYPETGYGYIKAGSPTGIGAGARVVAQFVEKPQARIAAEWVGVEDCYWNSGMFVFGAVRYLQELGLHAASIREAVREAHERAVRDLEFLRLDEEAFARSPAVSVDHSVMEHTSNAVVVPLDAGWSDIGSWAALSTLREHDDFGNTTHGDVILQGTRNTFIVGEDRLIAAVGLTDCVVVDTADALLVADKSAVQDVRKIVERLNVDGRDESRVHRKVYRPWGSYDVVHGGHGFKIKHITVNPGERLSLQMHSHRAEHWIVVRGIARVTRGEETFTVAENQSTYIPRGVRHRLENPGTAPLELIEVQSGTYLGEDDIVRFEDTYGRVGRDRHQA